MALYYYDKFTALPTTLPIHAYKAEWGTSSEIRLDSWYGYTSYNVNQSTGKFEGVGAQNIASASSNDTVYDISSDGSTIKKYWGLGGYTGWMGYATGTSKLVQTGSTTYYSKGSLVQSDIVAEDSTYPANGRHGDATGTLEVRQYQENQVLLHKILT